MKPNQERWVALLIRASVPIAAALAVVVAVAIDIHWEWKFIIVAGSTAGFGTWLWELLEEKRQLKRGARQ